MSLSILGAEVFDPALSGDYSEPVRLEVMVADLPEPTHTELDVGPYSIIHRNWLQSIFSDDWDDEDTRECAVTFNTSLHTESREPVFPVTIACAATDTWRDFYVKVSRVQRILARLARAQGQPGYEILPDPTYLIDKRIGYQLVHPSRICVRCSEEQAKAVSDLGISKAVVQLSDLPHGCSLHTVGPHRQVALCVRHRIEWDESHRKQREKETI